VSMRGDRYGQFPFERFEVFTTVTMQNAVFWDVTGQSAGSSIADFSTLKIGAICSSET
jgi:hypothetical protein